MNANSFMQPSMDGDQRQGDATATPATSLRLHRPTSPTDVLPVPAPFGNLARTWAVAWRVPALCKMGRGGITGRGQRGMEMLHAVHEDKRDDEGL
jgi:hypothetical protein